MPLLAPHRSRCLEPSVARTSATPHERALADALNLDLAWYINKPSERDHEILALPAVSKLRVVAGENIVITISLLRAAKLPPKCAGGRNETFDLNSLNILTELFKA